MKRRRAFWACLASGFAEPVGAVLGYLILAPILTESVFAAVFGVIAGIMVFLAMDELLPAAQNTAKAMKPFMVWFWTWRFWR